MGFVLVDASHLERVMLMKVLLRLQTLTFFFVWAVLLSYCKNSKKGKMNISCLNIIQLKAEATSM